MCAQGVPASVRQWLPDEGIGPLGHLKPVRDPRWERGFLKRLGGHEAFIALIAIGIEMPYKKIKNPRWGRGIYSL